MIEKNGKPFSPPEDQLDNIVKNFQDKNGHLILVWSKSRATSRPHLVLQGLPYEKTLEYPPSFPIATYYQVYNERGMKDAYRYYEIKTPGERGREDKYLPVSFDFSNTLIVTDLEQQWFLVYCCPVIENGIAGKAAAEMDKDYTPWLKIQLADVEARDKVKDMRTKNVVQNMILSDAPEQTVRDVAAMYRLADPDTTALDQLRTMLIAEIELESAGNPMKRYEDMLARFESVDNPDKKDEVAALVERALSRKIIGFNNPASAWTMLDEDGNPGIVLTRVNTSHHLQKRAVLEDHLRGNKEDLLKVRRDLDGVVAQENKERQEREAEKERLGKEEKDKANKGDDDNEPPKKSEKDNTSKAAKSGGKK